MSVEIFTPLPSAELETQLLAFFATHFRTWPQLRQAPDPLHPDEPEDFTAASSPTNKLFFGSEIPYKIGFRYGPIYGGERYYIHSLLHFIALRWGVRQPIFGDVRPVIYREGEMEALFIGTDTSQLEPWNVVDVLGIPDLFRELHASLALVVPGDLERIEQELMRLDQLAQPLLTR